MTSRPISRLVNDINDDEDDDDPEFDVMAELDDVDREDFFYELRDDRAVRVSKMEAKVRCFLSTRSLYYNLIFSFIGIKMLLNNGLFDEVVFNVIVNCSM